MAYAEPKLVNFKNIVQDASTAALVKTAGGQGWNAAVASSESIERLDSHRRGIRFKLSEPSPGGPNPDFFIGLASAPNLQQQSFVQEGVNFKCLAHALHIGSNSNAYVYEMGKNLGKLCSVKAGDIIDVTLNFEFPPKIEYRINGDVRYKSEALAVEVPLFIKLCAYSQSPLVEDLQWMLARQGVEGEVVLRAFNGIMHDPRTRGLSKIASLPSDTFNATVISADCIEDINSVRAGVTCEISESKDDQIFAVGFATASNPQLLSENAAFQSLAFAAYIHGNILRIYENNGVCKGDVGHVKAGDTLGLEVALDPATSNPRVEYRINGELRYASESEVHFPLHLKVCARSHGPLVEGLRWIHSNSRQQRPESIHHDDLTSPLAQHSAASTMQKAQHEFNEEKARLQAREKQLEAENRVVHAVAEETTVENVQLKVREMKLQSENEVLRAALEERMSALSLLTEEKEQLMLRVMQLQAECAALRSAAPRANQANSDSWELLSADHCKHHAEANQVTTP